jgi:hypothetical protein
VQYRKKILLITVFYVYIITAKTKAVKVYNRNSLSFIISSITKQSLKVEVGSKPLRLLFSWKTDF